MKRKFKITGMLILGALCFNFGAAFAEDSYDQIAREISEAGANLTNKKIAILPFSYADGRTATKDGAIVSERITMRLIKQQKFEVVERSMLDKVMGELKLQSTGVMDATSTQQLGKLLGVQAIVTGTLVEMQAGKIEVNARLIKTETAQAIGASQVNLDKDWVGDAATQQAVQPQVQTQVQPQLQQPVYEQPVYQQPAAKQAASAQPRGKYQYGFFDVFAGFGSPKMDLEFSNSNGNIRLDNTFTNDLGIKIAAPASYRSVTFEKLKTEGFGPLAFRVGGFGNKALGGDLELSYEKRNIAAQDTTWSLNGGAPAKFTFGTNDYATVNTFGISGDLLIRHPGERVDPYLGMGLGMSLNSITLPYVKGFTNGSFVKPTEEFALGLMFRIPVGMRIRLADKTQLVAELRYEINTMRFTRGGVSGEADTLTLSGVKFLLGMGFDF
ncbi:MAG: FlgO family outer membrane protein [Elusimicrobiales bacterium]|jgi:TolB-like protein